MTDANLSFPVLAGPVRRDRADIRAAGLPLLSRFLEEFCWCARVMKRERANGTAY
jgi:hypothetical protein